MKTNIARQWIKALRSGKYRQAKDALRKGGGFCCLGVLCDLHRKAGLGRWVKDGKSFAYQLKYDDDDVDSSLLPQEVCRWVGLRKNDPVLNCKTAAVMNDEGVPFPLIAAAIEKKYLKPKSKTKNK